MHRFFNWLLGLNEPECCGRFMESLEGVPGGFAAGDLYGCLNCKKLVREKGEGYEAVEGYTLETIRSRF